MGLCIMIQCGYTYMIVFNGWRLLTSISSEPTCGMACAGDMCIRRGSQGGGSTGGGRLRKMGMNVGGDTWSCLVLLTCAIVLVFLEQLALAVLNI